MNDKPDEPNKPLFTREQIEGTIKSDPHELQPGELMETIANWLKHNPDGIKEILESESERWR